MRKELIKRTSEVRTLGKCYELFRLEKKAKLLRDDYGLNEFKHFCSIMSLNTEDNVSVINNIAICNYVDSMSKLNYKIPSINHYLSSIRTFTYYCISNGWIDEFKISLIKGQEEKLKVYNENELSILLTKPKVSSSFTEWRSWAIVSFLISTGCRASTLINIEHNDIDYKNSEVTYRHLKNKKVAIIPLSNAILKVLNDLNSMFDLQESKYLFCEVNLDKMTVGALEKSIRNYCIRRKVEYKGIHTFRHTFACQWIKNNGNPMVLQKFLTHSTLDMTKKYIHLFSNDLHKDLELYNPLDNLKNNTRSYLFKRLKQWKTL